MEFGVRIGQKWFPNSSRCNENDTIFLFPWDLLSFYFLSVFIEENPYLRPLTAASSSDI